MVHFGICFPFDVGSLDGFVCLFDVFKCYLHNDLTIHAVQTATIGSETHKGIGGANKQNAATPIRPTIIVAMISRSFIIVFISLFPFRDCQQLNDTEQIFVRKSIGG